MSDKLIQTFNLPDVEQTEMFETLQARYNSSEDPNLKEIAKLALDSYKEIMLDVVNYDPKYRARNLEVAQTFLNLAKDALAKNTDLILKEEKQNNSVKKDVTAPEETFNRDEFITDLKNAGKKKA